MARKKDFDSMNTGRANAEGFMGQEAQSTFEAIEKSITHYGQQGTASPQEQAARASALKTQGRKGCKAVRINMAFTPENYEFIRIAGRAHGMTLTGFANAVIRKYREEHPEIFEKAKALAEESGIDEP